MKAIQSALVELAATIFLMVAAAGPAYARALVTAAQLEGDGSVAELRLELSGGARFRASVHHGNQLWIELDGTRSRISPGPLFGSENGPVKLVRAAAIGGDRARIIIVVRGRTDYAAALVGGELLVRVARAGAMGALAAPLLARLQPPKSARPPKPLEPAERHTPQAALARVMPGQGRSALRFSPPQEVVPAAEVPAYGRLKAHRLVIIDPGHGGIDPGAEADDGTKEKDLALEISRRLLAALGLRGIEAGLTRERDSFVALAERTKAANRAGADLFMSIHLNSSPNRETAGIESFYLDNTTERAAIRLARLENGSDPPYGASGRPDLNYIVADLRQQSKAIESAALARMIEAEVARQTATKVKALGAKRAPFQVLVGAKMPAVLVECGFLSNDAETARLRSAPYQQALAEAMADAIRAYLKGEVEVGNL